jgi:hypothetical protein
MFGKRAVRGGVDEEGGSWLFPEWEHKYLKYPGVKTYCQVPIS